MGEVEEEEEERRKISIISSIRYVHYHYRRTLSHLMSVLYKWVPSRWLHVHTSDSRFWSQGHRFRRHLAKLLQTRLTYLLLCWTIMPFYFTQNFPSSGPPPPPLPTLKYRFYSSYSLCGGLPLLLLQKIGTPPSTFERTLNPATPEAAISRLNFLLLLYSQLFCSQFSAGPFELLLPRGSFSIQ